VEWLITNSIVALILPPASLLVLAGAGALLALRHPRFGRSVIVASLAALWILSTPYVSDALVLGGGTYFAAPEYQGRDTVSSYGLTRLRYAAHLHRALKKPILVTGGAPLGNSTSEAEQMKQALEREFQVPVKWTEARANNTLENARLSNGLLRSAKINRIYLVTHAWHMPRARLAFERAGFEVIPAPTEYQTDFKLTVIHFIPGSVALADSSRYFHELIGLGWYHFRLMMGI
jgi:uncharacterized SAM-binding protein YcdF (DUF218 family)